MTKESGKSLRDIAERRVEQYIRDHIDAAMAGHAEDIVDLVIEVFEKPDRTMLDAGYAELAKAVHQQARKCDVRNLAGATWRSMMGRAH